MKLPHVLSVIHLRLPRLLLGNPDPAPPDRHHRSREGSFPSFHHLLPARQPLPGYAHPLERGAVGAAEGVLGFSKGSDHVDLMGRAPGRTLIRPSLVVDERHLGDAVYAHRDGNY